MEAQSTLELLRNHINISLVPFSDRGSRLLVFRDGHTSRLLVKLAERLTSIQPDIEAYRSRPPFLSEISLIDEQWNPLDFTVTTYPHMLQFETRLGMFRLAFQDERTLSFGVPDGVRAGISFHAAPQYWCETEAGGMFRSVRNLTYTTNGTVIDNVIQPVRGGYQVIVTVKAEEDRAINISIHPSAASESIEVLPFSTVLEVAEKRWDAWFKRVPPVDERFQRMYSYAWWVMGNNLISPLGNVSYEAMMPSKITYVGLWLWDSALHALAYRHIDPEMARNQIRAMLAHQLPNGMLPDAIFDEGLVYTIDHPITGEVTKPPILGWAALKLHETDPDISFLREIYPALVRCNAWWFSMNDDDDDGIVQYTHPYSSGLDDSPLWDYGMPIESPELNTYLYLQMESFSRMAEILGFSAESQMWTRRRTALLRRMIKDMWDEEAGLFWALKDEQPVRVVTPFNLYPLWTGQMPDAINERLIQHLLDPNEFGGVYPIPTVARNDEHYNPETMWRGPAWANINYFFIEALEKTGRPDLANSLTQSTLEMIAAHADVYEFYNSENGLPAAKAANIFGWTAAVFIDLAIRASQPAIGQIL
jgi:glycogen debranching enzyme